MQSPSIQVNLSSHASGEGSEMKAQIPVLSRKMRPDSLPIPQGAFSTQNAQRTPSLPLSQRCNTPVIPPSPPLGSHSPLGTLPKVWGDGRGWGEYKLLP